MLGATAGIIGTMQAMETVKLLAGIGENLKGKLMICDFRDMYFTKVEIFKRPDCLACSGEVAEFPVAKERLAWLCGHKTVNVNPSQPIDLGFDEVQSKLKDHFKILIKSSLVLVFEYDGGVEVSLFRRGRMLIKNVKDEESALRVYKDVMDKLGAD